MKFDKPANSAPTQLTAETVALAGRFEARRMREEDARLSDRSDPIMRQRIGRLFRGLSGSVACHPFERSRPSLAKPTDIRDWQTSQDEALERLEELQDRYAETPPKLSDELRQRVLARAAE